jgi:hypothetical protein
MEGCPRKSRVVTAAHLMRLAAVVAVAATVFIAGAALALAAPTPNVIAIHKQLSVPDGYRIDHGVRLDPVTGTIVSNLTSPSPIFPPEEVGPKSFLWDEYPQYTRDRKRVLFWRSSTTYWLDTVGGMDMPMSASFPFLRNVSNSATYTAGQLPFAPPFAINKYQPWPATAESPAMAMSPNGRWIVYGENHPKGGVDYSWLIAIDLAHHTPGGAYYTRIISRTTKPGWRFTGMEFTPDGQRLFVCESNKVSDGKMKLITFSTSSKLVYTWTMPALSADFAEDGSRVVYETPTHEMWWANGGNSKGKRQILSSDAYRPRFSNTTNRMVVSRGANRQNAWKVTYDGANFSADFLAGDAFQPDW